MQTIQKRMMILMTKMMKMTVNIVVNAGEMEMVKSSQSKIVCTMTGAKSIITLSFNELLMPKWTLA